MFASERMIGYRNLMFCTSSKAFRLRKVTVSPLLEKVLSALNNAQPPIKKIKKRQNIFVIKGCRTVMRVFLEVNLTE
jgi:hypothetical protein